MAIRRELTPEQAKQLGELYEKFVVMTADAGKQLRERGMDSKEFQVADHNAGEVMEQINRLIGRKTWMG